MMSSAYGATPNTSYPAKMPLMRDQRRHVNPAFVFLSLFLPFFLFTFLSALMSFSVHFWQPVLCNTIVAGSFVFVLFFMYSAFTKWKRRTADDARWRDGGTDALKSKSWSLFLACWCLLAWVAAFLVGGTNYSRNMLPYFEVTNLNAYPSVDPAAFKGQQLMDMGQVAFTEGTRLDLTKSMGFRNLDVYCVAPVTTGNLSASMPFYDFWAVGLNCCSGHIADFHCGEFNNPNAHSGLRLMRDDLRPYFRLAVQQAEAAHGIKTRQPIFLYWMQDPSAEIEAYQDEGFKQWLIATGYFLSFSFVLVGMATVFVSWLE